MFEGFSQSAVDFLWGLKFNNERGWFTAHKEEFLTALDRPMKELAAAVGDAMHEAYPKVGLQTHVSRIYRDARRLHGRGPYKESLWFTLRRPDDDPGCDVCFYFEIMPHAYSYGCGYWDMGALTAAKLRRRIENDPKPLAAIVRKLNRSRFTLGGEEYRRPKGDVGKLLNPWYNRKSIHLYYEDNCEGVLFTPELVQTLVDGFTELMPLYRYLSSLPGDPPHPPSTAAAKPSPRRHLR